MTNAALRPPPPSSAGGPSGGARLGKGVPSGSGHRYSGSPTLRQKFSGSMPRFLKAASTNGWRTAVTRYRTEILRLISQIDMGTGAVSRRCEGSDK
jgi:hypothetical protein